MRREFWSERKIFNFGRSWNIVLAFANEARSSLYPNILYPNNILLAEQNVCREDRSYAANTVIIQIIARARA